MRPPAPARPLAAIGAQHHPPGGRFLAWSSVDHGCPHRVMVCRLLACLCWRRMGSEATVVDVDAMVAGGGPNRLAAAVRLAEAGWSVCLVEANQDIGGSARTLECILPGFRHDLGAGFLALAMVSPATAGRDLARFGLRFCHAPLPAAHPLPGGRAIALGRSVSETAASIGRIDPGDARVWAELDGQFGDAVVTLVRAGMRRWPLGQGARLLGRLGPRDAAELVRLVLQGGSAIADRFASEEARAFLVAPGMHSDLQPEVPGSGAYALIMHLLGQRVGMPVAEGGSGAVSAALAAALRAADGVILTGRRVDRIVVEGGRAVGLEADGDAFRARRAVIAALHPDLVIRLAGPDAFPPNSLAQLRRYRHGIGTFKIDWALDGPVPWAAEECRRAGVVHVGDTVRDMSKAVWEAFYGLLPARPTLILGQQSLADPAGPRPASTPYGATPTCRPDRSATPPDPRPTPSGPARPSDSPTAWRRPSRPTPPASVTGSWPGGSGRRPIWRPPTPTSSGATSTPAHSPSTSSCCSARGWTGGAGARRSRACIWPGRACRQERGCTAPAATWPPGRPWPTSTDQPTSPPPPPSARPWPPSASGGPAPAVPPGSRRLHWAYILRSIS